MMSFELWQLFLVGVAYLGLLFLIAFATDQGWLPRRIARHPATYVLSLGVYATSWSFYGSVGFAQTQGYNFLTIYLGVTLAFMLAPVLLQPILLLTREYQLSSLADLFAFRYHSQLAGVLVTLLMLVGTLPYIALQVQAVTESLQILSRETAAAPIALGFCITVALFATLFGARHISPREKHEGLVTAIAFESLTKLIVLLCVGLFAIFGVFGGVGDMGQWLHQHPEARQALFRPVTEGPWTTLLLLAFAAAFLLPRQFHMAFVENSNSHALAIAGWAFPLYLLLLNLAIPPILWAGGVLELSIPADFYVLGVTLRSDSTLLPLLTFIGGISAASAMIIVTTLALANMCMNHLLLPASFPPQLNGQTDIYRWLLWGRRVLILLIISAGYGFFILLEHNQGLVQLGLIAFVAVAQFLPGIVGLLYWRRATRAGFIAGLLAGSSVWAATQLFPLLERADYLDTRFSDLSMQMDPLSFSTFWSLLLNTLLFVLFSLKTQPSEAEREAAAACCSERLRPPEGVPHLASIKQFEEQLAEVTGPTMAHHEIQRALTDLGLAHTQLHTRDLGRVREQITKNLSGLVGPLLARMIVEERLSLDRDARSALADTVRFVEQRLEASQTQLKGVAGELDALRRFHRQILRDLPIGVCAVGPDHAVVNWNTAMVSLSGLDERAVSGIQLHLLPEPWSGLLNGFLMTQESQLRQVRVKIGEETRVFNLHKAAIEGPQQGDEASGTVILVEDLTELYTLEAELSHSERLASLGRLAAGVAHEIGNPVTGIACLAQEMRAEPDDDGLREQGLSQILTQTERITSIVNSLVNFSHSGAPLDRHPGPVSPHTCIDEAIQLVSLSHAGKQLQFNNACEPGLLVLGEQQGLTQVFVNLLSNASDASQPGDPILINGHQAGNYIQLEVIDQGGGIPEQIQDKIFEPFYTTKEPGEGTGLGLSLVFNIVQEQGGTITLKSAEGEGSCFTLRLPLYRQNTNKHQE